MVLRATPPVWGTTLSAETAMKYPVSQSPLRYTLRGLLQSRHNRFRLASQKVPQVRHPFDRIMRRQLVSFAALNIPKYTACFSLIVSCFWREKLCDAFKYKLISLYLNYMQLSSNFLTTWLWSLRGQDV